MLYLMYLYTYKYSNLNTSLEIMCFTFTIAYHFIYYNCIHLYSIIVFKVYVIRVG